MITVLMGIPGSGKSTWVQNNKTGFEHVFNTEAVRINRELDIATFMNLNVRCAKSVLKWIDQSMKNETQSAAGQT